MPGAFWNSLNGKLASYPLHSELGRTVDQIVRGFSPVAVILFGSLARGDYLSDSDADLLVLLPRRRVDFLDTLRQMKSIDATGMVDIFPYGWRQFISMLEDYNILALDAMAEGYPLYVGDEQKWAEIRAAASNVFQRLEPVDGGWRVISP